MVQEQCLARLKSPLESLPTEIIQEIFLRCLEINLPRASIHIARALSDPVIYSWLVRFAFAITKSDGDDDDHEPFFTRHFLPPHAIVGAIDNAEMVNLRTQILGCRWCTLSVVRNCQVKFLSHVCRHLRQEMEIFPDDCQLVARPSIETRFDNLEDYDRGVCGHRGKADLILRARKLFKPPTSVADFKISMWFNHGVVDIEVRDGVEYLGNRYFELPFCPRSRVPDKLLGQPWTKTKFEFLELLATKACIDVEESFPRATRTLRQVIRDRDLATFVRLLDFYVVAGGYKALVPFPTRNPVFKAALRYAEAFNDPFVRILVEDRWGHIDPEDLRLKEQLLAAVDFTCIPSGEPCRPPSGFESECVNQNEPFTSRDDPF
ncbi:uncharacterized protein BJX67DRAFT_366730 [Aspergillus lucknowensis]|uniref:F-box domain-containing protein n=1 Tax=Aspergillus lucknowensis TaxID=176173 RepID=A0ABR4LCU9_9EURO